MYVLDFPYVVGFGKVEYDIFIKLLRNEEDLTEEEESRIDQMLQTAVKMKKVKLARNRQRRQRSEGYRPENPRRHRHRPRDDRDDVRDDVRHRDDDSFEHQPPVEFEVEA
jgi:hypothetical protein